MNLTIKERRKVIAILSIVLGMIPMVNVVNIIFVSSILVMGIISANVEFNNSLKDKFKFFNTFIYNIRCILCYYIISFIMTLYTYSDLLNKIENITIDNIVDYGFMLLDLKLILIAIPVTFSSLLLSTKEKISKKLFIIVSIINIVLLVFIIKY